MKLTKPVIDLICELEHAIGNSCYNPNSFDGYTLEEGCEFRYPVCYKGKDGVEYKTKGYVTKMDKDRINTMRYKFGSNHIFIGAALVDVLEILESRFDLDFNELTKRKK